MSFAQQWWSRARKVATPQWEEEEFDPKEVIRVKNFLSVNTEERVEIFKYLVEQFR